MTYMPSGSYCRLCLMADPKRCEECDFEEEEEDGEEEFEEEFG